MATEYEKLGRGVGVRFDERYVYLKVDMKSKAEESGSGKMELTASSSGFKEIGDTGYFVSVMGGIKVKNKK